MPGFLEQLGALVSAGDRNIRKLKEEEWLRANPGKPLPTGTGMVAQKEGMLQRGIRRVSEILADTLTTPGTAANQQFEGGFQAILNMVSPVDASTGMPNVDKAGLVLSATNMPKIRESMKAFLSENPELVAKNPAAARAMAFAKAKYPMLSSIADYRIIKESSDPELRGTYNAVTNTADIYAKPHGRRTEEIVQSIMHEATHSRQALRQRPFPPDPENEEYWDLMMDRAHRFDEEATKQSEAIQAVRDKSGDWAAYVAYRKDPMEVQAHRAGDTALGTFKNFQRISKMEGVPIPGSNWPRTTEIVNKTRMTFDDILGLLKGGTEK